MIFWIFLIYTSVASFGLSVANTCSQKEVFHHVIKSLPNCEPLDTLVKIELPNDIGHVEKFLPSHVLIPRCSGLHSGTCESLYYHSSATKCISSSKRNKEVMYISYDTFVNNKQYWKCISLNVTEDTSCECGCDIQEVNECIHIFVKPSKREIKGDMDINSEEKYACYSTRSAKKIWKRAPECRCECHPSQQRECSTGYVYDGIHECKCIEEISNRIDDIHCNHSQVIPDCNCPNRSGKIYLTECMELILLTFVIASKQNMPGQ